MQNEQKDDLLFVTKGKEIMEKRLGITKARQDFSQIVEHVQYRGDSYIIDRHGTPAAALVPLKVYEDWKRQRRKFFDLLRQMQEEADLSPEEAERLAAEAVRAVRTDG